MSLDTYDDLLSHTSALAFARDTGDLTSSATLLLFRGLVPPWHCPRPGPLDSFVDRTLLLEFEKRRENRGQRVVILFDEWTRRPLDAKISSSETKEKAGGSLFVEEKGRCNVSLNVAVCENINGQTASARFLCTPRRLLRSEV